MNDLGVMYILKNESMPNLYKLGMTRKDVESRLKSLWSTTSIPTSFNVVREFKVDHVMQLEKYIHRKLSSRRVNPKREFFYFTNDGDAVDRVSKLVCAFKPHDYTDKERRKIKITTKVSTANKAKAAGLKNLAELSELTGQSTQTLRNWDENKPELFAVVLEGAASKKLKR